jgi:hypothetical protein
MGCGFYSRWYMQEQGCQTDLNVWYILHFANKRKK